MPRIPAAPWIDLGCGTGASLEAAFPGRLPVRFGLDRSLGMLAAPGLRRHPRLVADIRRLPFPDGTATLLTAFYDVVNHLRDRPELETAFAEVRRVLRPGATFAFDLSASRHLALWNGAVQEHALTDGGRLRLEGRFDRTSGRLTVEARRRRDGHADEMLGRLEQRAFPSGLVASLLRSTGFASIEEIPVRKHRGRVLRSLWTATR